MANSPNLHTHTLTVAQAPSHSHSHILLSKGETFTISHPQEPTEEQLRAFEAALRYLLVQNNADWTGRHYKKCIRVLRAGRVLTARKAAIRCGVPSTDIDATMTLIGI